MINVGTNNKALKLYKDWGYKPTTTMLFKRL